MVIDSASVVCCHRRNGNHGSQGLAYFERRILLLQIDVEICRQKFEYSTKIKHCQLQTNVHSSSYFRVAFCCTWVFEAAITITKVASVSKP